MGLRLSLDSSESESNNGSTSTAHVSASYNHDNHTHSSSVATHRTETHRPTRDRGEYIPPNIPPDTRSIHDIVRELEQGSANETYILRMLSANQQRRGTRNATRRREHRSSASISYEPTSTVTTTTTTTNPRDSQHRGSLAGLDSSSSSRQLPTTRRTRRSEQDEPTLVAWDSSDSAEEDGESASALRLSTLMLRHFQLGPATSTRPRRTSPSPAENELIRVLRLSAARASYNVDRLDQDKGECSICLEDLVKDDMIARLPCLCIYHKKCIDSWFKRRPVCPEHPGDN